MQIQNLKSESWTYIHISAIW